MFQFSSNAARSAVMRRALLGLLGVASAYCLAPTGLNVTATAHAALLIHTPDGRPLAAPVTADAMPPALLATDDLALSVQLAEAEVERYRRIFAHQDRQEWKEADAEIARLKNKSLMGHVLQHRYLHPDRRARYDEMARWLERYADLGGAERIHSLAQARQPAGQSGLKSPREYSARLIGSLERLGGLRPQPLPGTDTDPAAAGDDAAAADAEPIILSSAGNEPPTTLTLSDTEGETSDNALMTEAFGEGDAGDQDKNSEPVSVSPRSRQVERASLDHSTIDKLEELLRNGQSDAALKLLDTRNGVRRIDSTQYDAARTRIATQAFYSGSISQALQLASASAGRSGEALPQAHWIAGLAAWRLKQYERATRHFEAMAEMPLRSTWTASGAAYWAGRGHRLLGNEEKARGFFGLAARFPHTFYGLVAIRTIGDKDDGLEWRLPDLTGEHLAALASVPAGKRAIALLQVDRKDMAEQELRRVHPNGNALIEQALIILSDGAGLSALSLRLGNALTAPDGAAYTAALYPLPHWRPRDGFAVDRALLFAVMRKESRFEPRLVSSAGARGLMQIMPATAQHVQSRASDLDDNATQQRAMFDPATNMEVGQRYLAELLAMPMVSNNLFYMTAAYNAGPGVLQRWKREMKQIKDPLLFIESIPYAETRDYVEKVTANFWIYRLRLGQEMSTLDAVAAGEWPIYTPVDAEPPLMAAVTQAEDTDQIAENAEGDDGASEPDASANPASGQSNARTDRSGE